MPYFRDNDGWDDDYAFHVVRAARNNSSLLREAQWAHWCGWDREAQRLLVEICESFEDEEPQTEAFGREIPDHYEETRFGQEETPASAAGKEEDVCDAG